MAVRKILQIGDPKLKAKNKPVIDFNKPSLLKLIKDLKDTMLKAGLIGIAAPQIGENYQLFVTQPRSTKARAGHINDTFRVYINPQIIAFSKEQSLIYEGCASVSFGTLFGPVKRPKIITVKAQNEKGDSFTLKCDGILARVIQHEYDHLLGVEFLQKISDPCNILHLNFYRKFIRKSKEQKQASKITIVEYNRI